MERISEKVWHNGELIDFDDAKIHVLSHVVHYGSSVFEGVRCYDIGNRSLVFRLREHIKRLLESAYMYRMKPAYTVDQLVEACLATVKANKMKECYIRPVIFRGTGGLGVNPFPCAVEAWILVWKWGAYLGAGAADQGVDVQVSSWRRLTPNTMPAMAKAASNYMNSQLTKMEAISNGFVEGIMLDHQGLVSEGSGENIFVVREGKIYTPPLYSSILLGITRDSIMQIARSEGLEVIESPIPREMLYVADEIFFTGTAAEVTPIRSVDKITIGIGKRGPITERLQNKFMDVIKGKSDKWPQWCTFMEHNF